MRNKPSLLVATGNPGKVAEMRVLFAGTSFVLKNLPDFPGIVAVEETGTTFEENAVLKAVGYARQTGSISLADDSGLEIEALGNAPGVLSARYAGQATPYDQKIAKLLGELAQTSDKDRAARFVCSMAVADQRGNVLVTSTETCKGTIAHGPRGANGFGYDPIFIPTGCQLTFGELPDGIKHEISHRARASKKIMRYLLGFTAV